MHHCIHCKCDEINVKNKLCLKFDVDFMESLVYVGLLHCLSHAVKLAATDFYEYGNNNPCRTGLHDLIVRVRNLYKTVSSVNMHWNQTEERSIEYSPGIIHSWSQGTNDHCRPYVQF